MANNVIHIVFGNPTARIYRIGTWLKENPKRVYVQIRDEVYVYIKDKPMLLRQKFFEDDD